MPLEPSNLPFVAYEWQSARPSESVMLTFRSDHTEKPISTVATLTTTDQIGPAGPICIPAEADEPNRPTVTRLAPRFEDGTARRVFLVAGEIARMSPLDMTRRIQECRKADKDALIIAVPIWSTKEASASDDQRSFSLSANRAGADLSIGLGTLHRHPIDLVSGRLRFHGLGSYSELSFEESQQHTPKDFALEVDVRVASSVVEVLVRPRIRHGVMPIEDFYTDLLVTTKDSAAILQAGNPVQNGDLACLSFTLGPSGRVPVIRRKIGSITTATVWDAQPETITVPRKKLASSILLTRAFERLGTIPDSTVPGFFAGESPSGMPYLLKNARTQFSSEAAARETDRKEIARDVLTRAGIVVAEGRHYTSRSSFEQAHALLKRVGTVVVKPVDGRVGQGVTVDVTDPKTLADAWERAFDHTESGVLVEQQFRGDEVRIFVVDGKVAAVAQRIPPQVTGDGTSTIRDLLNRKNAARHADFALQSKPIELTPERVRKLRASGLTPLTVLPAGQTYVVDQIGNIKVGAEPADVTSTIHDSYVRIAERAVASFPGMHAVGVDIIATDITKPATIDNHIVIELNGNPDISLHASARFGQARDVAADLAASALTPRTSKTAPMGRKTRIRPAKGSTSEELLAAEFESRGYSLHWTSPRSFHAKLGAEKHGVWGSVTDQTSSAAFAATQHPAAIDWLLRRAELPTADGRRLTRAGEAEARAFAERHPMVNVLAGGLRPIAVDTSDARMFAEAWRTAYPHATLSGITVTRRHTGVRARYLVAHRRVLAVITDNESRSFASRVHPSYSTLAASAAAAIPGLDLAEVTLVVDDLRVPARRDSTIVESVRAEPDLPAFSARGAGRVRDVTRVIVDLHTGSARPAPAQPFEWPGRAVTPSRRILQGLRRTFRARTGR